MASQAETALVVLVPEAEFIVKEWRDKYDPSAADGMGAHVTILYPFKQLDDIGPAIVGDLEDLFSRHSPFDFSLNETGRFPGVLYLAPSPDGGIKELIRAVAGQYPETPLYGGVSLEVIPHLTVAQVKDNARLDEISREFHRASYGELPIHAHADRVCLMVKQQHGWEMEISLNCHANLPR